MEIAQIAMLTVLGGIFLYLINRTYRIEKLVNETHGRLGILENVLLKAKEVRSDKKELAEKNVLKTKVAKADSQKSGKSRTEEFRRLASARKKAWWAAKRAERPEEKILRVCIIRVRQKSDLIRKTLWQNRFVWFAHRRASIF